MFYKANMPKNSCKEIGSKNIAVQILLKLSDDAI